MDDVERPDDTDRHDEHLSDVADGCGCAEIWEHLSDRRNGEKQASD